MTIFTSNTFPAGWILIEVEAGKEYVWETEKGQSIPCSTKFVAARQHAWKKLTF